MILDESINDLATHRRWFLDMDSHVDFAAGTSNRAVAPVAVSIGAIRRVRALENREAPMAKELRILRDVETG